MLISALKLWQRKLLALGKKPKNDMKVLIIHNNIYYKTYKNYFKF